MFEQIPAPENVLAVQLSGKLTGDDIESYSGLLEDKLENQDRINIWCDLVGLSDMSAEAIVEGAKADLKLLRHVHRFARFAIVSDKDWPRAMIGLVSPVLPKLEMKAFSPHQADDALKWATEIPETRNDGAPALRIVRTSREDVLAFDIDGVVTADQFPEVIEELNAFLDRHEKVRLLGRITNLAGFDPSVFMQSGLFSMKLAAMQKVERYAVVGAPGWMKLAIETMNPAFSDIDMRTFARDREDEAWDWLGAKPVE